MTQVAEPEPARRVGFRPPRGFELRPYQVEAIRAWSQAGGKGIFAMATGSGKTPTALTLASKVAEKNRPLVLIVVCPFINLCRQWIRELAGFGLNAVGCFEGRERWQAELEEGYQRLTVGLAPVQAVVATSTTFSSLATVVITLVIRGSAARAMRSICCSRSILRWMGTSVGGTRTG